MPTRQEIYETTYVCDPKKASDCPKTHCRYLNGRRGGLCRCTRNPAQAARDRDGNPITMMDETTTIYTQDEVREALAEYLAPWLVAEIINRLKDGEENEHDPGGNQKE